MQQNPFKHNIGILFSICLYILTLGSLIIDIAETDRERAILENVVAIFKAYSVLLIVLPIAQILIYNIALDFKVSSKNIK